MTHAFHSIQGLKSWLSVIINLMQRFGLVARLWMLKISLSPVYIEFCIPMTYVFVSLKLYIHTYMLCNCTCNWNYKITDSQQFDIIMVVMLMLQPSSLIVHQGWVTGYLLPLPLHMP